MDLKHEGHRASEWRGELKVLANVAAVLAILGKSQKTAVQDVTR